MPADPPILITVETPPIQGDPPIVVEVSSPAGPPGPGNLVATLTAAAYYALSPEAQMDGTIYAIADPI